MRNYSFGRVLGYDEIPTEVLSLFTDLVDNPSQRIDCGYEVVQAGMANRIDFSRPFNLEAYQFGVKKKQQLGYNEKRKHELSLEFSCNDDEVPTTYDSITEDAASNQIANKVKDAYEELLASAELTYAVSTIKNLNVEMMTVEGIDLIRCLKEAVNGVTKAIMTVKRISECYPYLGKSLETILSSGEEIGVLFA